MSAHAALDAILVLLTLAGVIGLTQRVYVLLRGGACCRNHVEGVWLSDALIISCGVYLLFAAFLSYDEPRTVLDYLFVALVGYTAVLAATSSILINRYSGSAETIQRCEYTRLW